ncbi:prepilin-type N-terminal cleavage/methylation domain-containing protein [Candidatus Kaiserbacteria bacterium]|nr:MAG: prepilin-type N-terminal cleavage/methylation domain-containing protein [Candidatus Kaiserbacteria bacterium]
MVSLYKKKQNTFLAQAGFTVIELIVVVGILGVISSITLTSYSKFGGQILLRNLAYDVALSIRQAQVYGISARSFLGAQFASGHGVYFDFAEGSNKFFLYTDTDGNNFYTSAGTEWVETFSIGRGHSIDRLCVPSGPSSENCAITSMDILFKRPEPDAIIRASVGGSFTQYDRARIVLDSPQGNKLSVLIESTGQISIQRYAE